jgi:copper chaperone CopZ
LRVKSLILFPAVLSLAASAQADVKQITVGAGGVLCLSCVHRVEKAIERVSGVEKVHVQMDPVAAQVTPRGGMWLDPERLRNAIKNAGFKPGDVRCTISGPLVDWHGQPAIRLTGSDRVIVLQSAPDHAELLAPLRQKLAAGGASEVEVEGAYISPAAKDSAAPTTLKVEQVRG